MPEQATETDLAGIVQMLCARAAAGRLIAAVAGPPGAGKSTLADSLAALLNGDGSNAASVLAMDGYHFDNRILEARGLRARKGAPDTFDVLGLAHMLRRLRDNDEP